MRQRHRIGMLLMALLPACSATKPEMAPMEAVPYPDSDAGRALRTYYESPRATAAQLNALTRLLNGADRIKVHAELRPALEVIVAQDDTERGLIVAYLLSDDESTFKAEQAAMTRLVPALVRGLKAPPVESKEPAALREASPIMCAMFLARLGPDASYAYAGEVGRSFNTPAVTRIESESDECWRRYGLAELQVGYGGKALPALLLGLHHGDPWVRDCSVNALKEMYAMADARDVNGRPGWDAALPRVQGAKPEVGAAAGQVSKLASDPDETVRKDAQSFMKLVAGE